MGRGVLGKSGTRRPSGPRIDALSHRAGCDLSPGVLVAERAFWVQPAGAPYTQSRERHGPRCSMLGDFVAGSIWLLSQPVTLNLSGAVAGHLEGCRRSSVNVNGRLPFKVCHQATAQIDNRPPIRVNQEPGRDINHHQGKNPDAVRTVRIPGEQLVIVPTRSAQRVRWKYRLSFFGGTIQRGC